MTQLSQEEIKAIASATYADPVAFCYTFLRHWFPDEIVWFQRGIMAILTRRTQFLKNYGELDKIIRHFVDRDGSPLFSQDATGNISLRVSKYTVIRIPRGFSKTTICNAMNIMEICFKDCDFTAYISETDGHASRQLKNVKDELDVNEKIKAVFGALKPEQRQGKPWNETEAVTANDCILISRGRGGQIRGANVGAKRPKKIVIDDMEDKESVSTHEQRLKAKTYYYGDVKPALRRRDPEAAIIFLGTVLHREALLQEVADDPDYTTVTLSVTDLDGEPLWPQHMSQKDIDSEKASYARKGHLALFYMEYHNQITNEETQKFHPAKISVVPYSPHDYPYRAIAIDPAISPKKGSDNCAFSVVGMSPKGQICVIEHFMKVGMTPREQVDKYFELAIAHRPRHHGVEVVAYQQALVHLLREEMFRKKYYFEPIEIRHTTAKLLRVEGILAPRYSAGYIVHAKRFPEYEIQLSEWPNGKLDGPDVVAMAVSLLDPHAANAAGDEDLAADQYEPLEKLLGNTWQRAP